MQIAVIEGDDAAPEAMRPSLEILERLNRHYALGIDWVYPPIGAPAEQEFGSPFPMEAQQIIDAASTTYFGSTSGNASRALFYLRWGKETYANVRPCRYFMGMSSPLSDPTGIDFVVVRENLEDLYLGIEGDLDELRGLNFPQRTRRGALSEIGEGRYAVKAITRHGTERVVRFAFELAQKRAQAAGRVPHVTCTAKYNMLARSDGYFVDIARDLAAEYPDVELDTFIIDDFACRIIAQPKALDVVVMPNLYGDIMSDAAAGLIGGLGLAASGCYGRDYAYFESAHGTAPDIAGQNIINPTATLLSGVMMLNYLGFVRAGESLERAIEATYADGHALTPDQGGTASTTDFCASVSDHLGV
ncbi:MAG: isocitrate/isopropylmalate family dehydrogenase [Pseudomonadales bacterium]